MSSESPSIVVLGAGVAGLCAALYLQRSGQRVLVIDAQPPASGTSYGNAGLISKDTAVPIALPGMMRKVPRWLTDREGPLRVSPSYMPAATPWLWRWIQAGQMSHVLRISDAMRALHKDALDCWRELLGAEDYDDLIRPVGQVRIWEGEGAGAQIELDICRRHGIEHRQLDQAAIRDLYPEIAPDITQGLLIPGNAYTVNPQRLVRTLARKLAEAGGQVLTERVVKIIPREGGGYRLMNNVANHHVRRVVVSAGAWSTELLAPLGVAIPLETERGYHAMMPSPNLKLKVPMSVKNRGFGLTSMEEGLRAAGTVEIAGLQAPPDERRAEVLVRHARRIFPKLQTGEPAYWLGHRPSSPDSLPFIGPVPGHEGLYLCLGHGHFGMTGGPPSGRLLSRLVSGQAPGFDPAPYAVDRF
ncbi:MAG: FAD-dependent oxidoreductase [Rubrivivax sp.]|nr:FAD-dependent oxidoreductase [Rubrivivax sp.]